MASQSEAFFVDYAKALDAGDVDALTNMHFMPSVFVSDETKHICALPEDIQDYNGRLVGALKRAGVVRHEPQVNQAMRLSDSIMFVTVKWRMKDDADATCFECYCSYTIQTQDDKLKIVVAVLDDENQKITQLLKQRAE